MQLSKNSTLDVSPWIVRYYSRRYEGHVIIAYVPCAWDAATIAHHYAAEYGHGIDVCDGSQRIVTAHESGTIVETHNILTQHRDRVTKAHIRACYAATRGY